MKRRSACPTPPGPRRGLTLIEMLVSLAVTLVMMAAVVNLFANMSASVRNRRAGLELGGQLRQIRQQLELDLAGATCPPIPWQKPDNNVGYLEIVEGQWSDKNPSWLVDGTLPTNNGADGNPELDFATSLIPSGSDPLVRFPSSNPDPRTKLEREPDVTNGRSLGDYDDILSLTVRSTGKPFRGQGWKWVDQDADGVHDASEFEIATIESNEAEVVWYAVENPAGETTGTNGALGEPGFRTIYRRVFLIAPWLPPLPTYYYPVGDLNSLLQTFDVSCHYDRTTDKWAPNTLVDLTRRENRVCRNGVTVLALQSLPALLNTDGVASAYPYNLASDGSGNRNGMVLTGRPVSRDSAGSNASFLAVIDSTFGNRGQAAPILGYRLRDGGRFTNMAIIGMPGLQFPQSLPYRATPRPVMKPTAPGSQSWQVAAITNGPAPLAFDRSGSDVALTDALAFDVRVYDPGAPVYQSQTGVAVEPSDVGWQLAAVSGSLPISYGAYVDLGWAANVSDGNYNYNKLFYPAGAVWTNPLNVSSVSNPRGTLPTGAPLPAFHEPHRAGWHPSNVNLTSPQSEVFYGFPCVYDPWSFQYENDGINQDAAYAFNLSSGIANLTPGSNLPSLVPSNPWQTDVVDQGTNGVDDDGLNGVDDPAERETSPPYNVNLRGVKVILRTYERDSRQIREASVTHSFVP